jgi:hypothetical protein
MKIAIAQITPAFLDRIRVFYPCICTWLIAC